jgi:glycosyltransferase involved in cell wall biosynthesis
VTEKANGKRQPRVMLVGLFPPAQGGVTTFLLNLVGSGLSEDYRFEAYSISRPPKKNVVDNWGYASFFRGGVRRMLVGLTLTAWRLLAFPCVVLARRIDLIQVQASDYQQFWEATLYVAMARALRRPVLMRLGGAFDLFYDGSSPTLKRLIARAIARPDMLIVQSEYWRGVLARVGRSDGVVVLNNFILEASIGNSRSKTPSSPTCLFIAGSEARRKGLDVLLDALDRLRTAGVGVRVVMIAVPPVAAERIAAAGFGDAIEMRGDLSRDEVLREMRRADIFLLPSFGEGFPNSLVEAMAQGMAAIVTPVGSVPEAIGEGGGALVVPAGDPAALAEAIGRLAGSPENCARMGVHNQDVIRARFTSSVVLSTLDGAYRRLLVAQSSPA